MLAIVGPKGAESPAELRGRKVGLVTKSCAEYLPGRFMRRGGPSIDAVDTAKVLRTIAKATIADDRRKRSGDAPSSGPQSVVPDAFEPRLRVGATGPADRGPRCGRRGRSPVCSSRAPWVHSSGTCSIACRRDSARSVHE
jgi:hypothetical protein